MDAAFTNLSHVFSQESATMNDISWEADEQKKWSEQVEEEKEKRVLELDLDALSFVTPEVLKVSRRKTFSALYTKCIDLKNS